MHRVKITVAKITTFDEMFGENPPLKHIPPSIGRCVCFEEGQEFSVESPAQIPPQGFCAIAWADIQRDVVLMMFGGHYPWFEKEGACLTCCTDGLNPVIFKIERMEKL